jgi:predicted transglutaminase-like cysteine proteinase
MRAGWLLAGFFLLWASPAQAESFLGYVGFRADTLSALPRWTRVLDKLEYEKKIFARCDADIVNCHSPPLVSWRAFMAEQRGLPKAQQLREVNTFANRWPYTTDDIAWGRSDYWATPKEFIEHTGDCEDYAILKYVSLRELGFSKDELRIAVVQDVVRDIAHAVLAVYTEEGVVVLDSLFTAVLEQDSIMQYTPYYSVNETSRWVYIPPLKALKK